MCVATNAKIEVTGVVISHHILGTSHPTATSTVTAATEIPVTTVGKRGCLILEWNDVQSARLILGVVVVSLM